MDNKNCYIEVANSGIGIPEEAQEHIFERFYRVDKSHSREIGGTGLGLAIARSAVVMHRGAIKVLSQPSEGCPERKRYQKERGTGYVSGATPTLPLSDGAPTRFAQTIAPSPALTVPALTLLRLCRRAAR